MSLPQQSVLLPEWVKPGFRARIMTPLIPSIELDTDRLPASERFARFAEGLPIYELTALSDGGPESFSANVKAWSLGDLVVTSGRLSPLRWVRSAKAASRDGHDNLSFILLTDGSAEGDAEGRRVSIGPGQIAAFDLGRPFFNNATQTKSLTLGVSRRAMQNVVATLPDLHGRILDGIPGRLVADHLFSLVRFLPVVREADVPVLIKATLGLVAGCLASLPAAADEPVLGFALRYRARRHIDQNLGSAELSPDQISRDLGISRSTLNRAFSPTGGVAAYIQGRRLEAVHAILARTDEGRSIAEIAYEFGFASASHFSTAFRNRFGYSPGQARAGERPPGTMSKASNGGVNEQFRLWMEQFAAR